MNEQTLEEIKNINKHFYRAISNEFSDTRNSYWEGWNRVGDTIFNTPGKLNVLDIGCGNGRFGKFLYENYPNNIETYLGIDENENLLNIAKLNLKEFSTSKVDNQSIYELFKIEKQYHIVTAFGVSHHIPSSNYRIQWFKEISKLVTIEGYLVITFWDFIKSNKILNTPLNSKLEKGDYILGWDNTENVCRYCHLYDNDEHNTIDQQMKESNFTLIDKYLADGRTKDLNLYKIWQKK